jgi:hypothetical protein
MIDGPGVLARCALLALVASGCGARVAEEDVHDAAPSVPLDGATLDAPLRDGAVGADVTAIDDGASSFDTAVAPDVVAVDATARDASVADASPVVSPCPDTPPKPGDTCATGPVGIGHYSCYYYAPGETCPTNFKCGGVDTPPFAWLPSKDTGCIPPRDACAEGLPCGPVDSACIVMGERRCTCDWTTSRLVCAM